MLQRQFCLNNNLSTHKDNTDFPWEKWEKSWKLPSTEVNFKGCDQHDLEAKNTI